MLDIQEFADQVGIARTYKDVMGRQVTISPEARLAALGAMGYPVQDMDMLMAYLEREQLQEFTRVTEPVQVLTAGDKWYTLLRTPASLSENAVLSWRIEFEKPDAAVAASAAITISPVKDGELAKERAVLPDADCFAADGSGCGDTVMLSDVEIAWYKTVQGTEYDARRLYLPAGLPLGYHQLHIKITDGQQIIEPAPMLLIVTPDRCYIPEKMQQGEKVWGISTQLYSLRSRHNWGIGDFHDLKNLLRSVARQGGQFVGLNPLHAGYPANPDPDMVSPYSPSSRLWLNIIYIRVEDIPEYASCKQAVSLVNSKAFQQKLRALREREYVDYRQVIELKLQVLRLIFDTQRVDDKRSIRGRKFMSFVEQGGSSLLNMATYDALQSYLYARGVNAWGFEQFPREYRQASSPFMDEWRSRNKAEVLFYSYLQFIAQEQLEDAYAAARKEGMLLGTYRDLAVGVGPGSCDVWSDDSGVYRKQASVGAPPDPLGPLGQSWGLSPMDPHRLKLTAYRDVIALYQANMRSCGALRIDHAAGLARFWWVPPEKNPLDGAYVQSNLHDMLGIIALESVRNKCLIIAEDLGTIPDELRVALKKYGTYSYKIFFGERAGDGGFIAPQDYAEQAMSALTTHDMPTLKGWWEDLDLTLGQKLGIYTAQIAADLKRDRANARQRILDSLHGLGSAGDNVPRNAADIPQMTPALASALQVHMCRGSCALYSAQLEDFIGVEKPVNVPGTFREYPNWRRKLTLNLDDIFARPAVCRMTQAMTRARADASAIRSKR